MMITIMLNGGIGNRIRALNSAIKLAKDTEKKLKILWPNDNTCPCDFEDLFDRLDGIDWTVGNIRYNGLKTSLKTKDVLSFGRAIIFLFWYNSESIARLKYKKVLYNLEVIDQELFIKVKNSKSVFIKSSSNFYANEDYAQIKFNRKLLKIVEEIMKKQKFIGIHIRQGDNIISRKESPLKLFIKKMDELLLIDPSICFFVSTDDRNILEILIERYPEKCYYYTEKSWNRYSREGQLSALVELLCLARTKKIYGSYWSSFSEEAAKIGRIEKETLKIAEKLDL